MPPIAELILYFLGYCFTARIHPAPPLPEGRYASQDSELSDYSLGDFWDIEEE